MKRLLVLVLALTLILSFFSLYPATKVSAKSSAWCGNGSAPDYGFTMDLSQPHWTVNGEGYVSEDAINQVDVVLDGLNSDNVAQTMILFLPADQVSNPTNCAVHFLRYMLLGQPDGERADNGFVFLYVVGPSGKPDVHYAVGLGLPALTAQGLTPLNRLAEDTYTASGSMDRALVDQIKAFDSYARSKYEPWHPEAPTAEPYTQPAQDPGSSDATIFLTALICLIALAALFLSGYIFMRLIDGKKSEDNDFSYDPTPYTPIPSDDSNEPVHHYEPQVHHDPAPIHHYEQSVHHEESHHVNTPTPHFDHPSPRPSSPPSVSRGGSGSGRSGRTN